MSLNRDLERTFNLKSIDANVELVSASFLGGKRYQIYAVL